ALAAVGHLHHVVQAACLTGQEAGVDQPPLRVTGHRVLDLDHFSAPFGEHRPAGGHEGPHRDLQHPYPVQHLRHPCLPATQRLLSTPSPSISSSTTSPAFG